ncbi:MULTISPECIES: helix-turn-helix transcriptional regulator [unclassified Streptomyces]|uniref:helix-turn-helix domain-containing protein n=1 Tax=Streptomyces sp. 2314.4 TaxID=1881025 RepID=UPI0018FEBDF8
MTEELHTLSRAEHWVAQLAEEGLTNRETAEQLGVTPRTVEQHLPEAGGAGSCIAPVALNSVDLPGG